MGTGGLDFLIAYALMILCHSLFKVVVDDIEKRGKIAVLLVCTVNTIVDSNKPHTFLHKQDFRIKTDFQIITPQTGHILDYQHRYFAVLYLLNEFVPTWTVEVRTRKFVIYKEHVFT